MYKKLEYNTQSFSVNIYAYISPLAEEVIHINQGYKLDEIYTLYPFIKDLAMVFDNEYSLPLIILKYKNNESVLLAKISHEQESVIRNFIEEHLSLSFAVRKRQYKDVDILFYSLSDGRFLVCTFYKGLFAVSRDFRPVKIFIDSDPENTFFHPGDGFADKMLAAASASVFIRAKSGILAADYISRNDSVKLDGYVLGTDSLNHQAIPYMINLPDTFCIDNYTINDTVKPVRVKIFINKKF
jgi:hypothetical protein